MGMKLIGILAFFLPTSVLRIVSRLWGWEIESGARIGFSYVSCLRLSLKRGARIGHFNYIDVEEIFFDESAYLLHLNYIRGGFSLVLDKFAGIGNQNRIYRGPMSIRGMLSTVRVGYYGKITSRHSVECLCDFKLGNYSIIAGSNTQIWTHGYYHYPKGLDRFRIDGSVTIGDNVYIGASCVISMGVHIADSISVGSHSSVARSLTEPGLYVSQPLRYIPTSPEGVLKRLTPLPEGMSIERAYEKNDN